MRLRPMDITTGRICDQTPEDFEKDLVRSSNILERITGKKVKGYRAPQFTIVKETLWALEILRKAGLEYDSSVFPVKTPLYGMPDSPLFPYRVGSEKTASGVDFMEIPLSVYKIPLFGKNIPIAGGFYLRALPYVFIRHALKKLNRDGNVAICYVHPWEFDPGKPRVDSLKWYHYYRLNRQRRNSVDSCKTSSLSQRRIGLNMNESIKVKEYFTRAAKEFDDIYDNRGGPIKKLANIVIQKGYA